MCDWIMFYELNLNRALFNERKEYAMMLLDNRGDIIY